MDLASSKTLEALIIPELDNCNLDLEKNWPYFFKIVLKKIVISDPNRLYFRLSGL